MLLNKKKLHFVGIGGIGMSGIAQLLLDMGYSVSGSDLEASHITRKLEALGARISCRHSGSNVSDDTDAIIYSSSIAADNPELAEGRRRGIKIAHRAELLGELFNCRKGIAVTGTHGKTTTASLISVMLEYSGLDPTAVIGGEVGQFAGNARRGKSDYMVVEADESDSSFVRFRPLYSVITNIEPEHLDHFKDLAGIKKAYGRFAANTKQGGVVFYNREDPELADVMSRCKSAKMSFGFCAGADIYPLDVKMNGFNTSFKCVYRKKMLGRIGLCIPGAHNIANALAAVLVGLKLGIKFDDIAASLKQFRGAKRRFQLRADERGVMLIDDYAHHPTEIKAVINTCRNWSDKRLIAVFQPHRYTRTKFLAGDFGSALSRADKLILTDIYAASEKAIRGVSIRNIYDKVLANGLDDVSVIRKEKIAGHVMQAAKPGDIILVMGAGDIKNVADDICDRMKTEGRVDKELLKRLKLAVKGDISLNEKLGRHTSLRIGGPADIWVRPRDRADLSRLVKFAKGEKIRIFVIGNGTNLLADDAGFRGIVAQLGSPAFRRIGIKGNTVTAGAGAGFSRLIRTCCDNSLGGLESLVGIPGTVGGALYMNAGGWRSPIFKNIGDLAVSVRVMDRNGRIRTLKKNDLKFAYRNSNLGPYIILEVTLRLMKADKAAMAASASRFLKMKRQKQVLDLPSAGCVFKNPSDSQFTCGQMIDMLGLKGKSIGGAQISTKHANFIINKKDAACEDVLGLVKFIKDKVMENYGISLELEIKVI